MAPSAPPAHHLFAVKPCLARCHSSHRSGRPTSCHDHRSDRIDGARCRLTSLTVTDPNLLTSLRREAEAAVAALEQVPLGEPHAVAEERAREAVMDVRSPALLQLFPEMPTQRAGLADVISVFEFYEQQFTRSKYWQHVADLHRKAIDIYPELAEFIRSGMVSERVLFVANSQAVTTGRTPSEFADEVH